MIEYLHQVEQKLPGLLTSLDGWNRLKVVYEKPYVERLWRQDGNSRIYLHRILPCEDGEAFYHTHPWPSAMRLLSGSYYMKVGFLSSSASLTLAPGSTYEMIDPRAKHSVRPIGEPTLSLMVTGPIWTDYVKPDECKNIVNEELHIMEALALLQDIRTFYP